ncbi:hypothetical protein C8A03DRAFT_39047 [Achaetomium macrosporum]|uniref:Uncharacterized protein n=1 Tax=Achaetomium macrosporum TaxID=79813 RepID=A0AAN7C0V1_9PEZI|nr:hypothetical protein C8A03DRAFT_39047 [Achaetomium macrosporum]
MSLFRDEYELLLQDAGIEHNTASQMLDDLNREDWAGLDLDDQIRNFLGKRYDEWKRTAEQIYNQVSNLDTELSLLEDSDYGLSERGKLAVTAHRARRAVGVVSKKSSLEEGIEALADLITEFRRLRKVAKELHEPRVVCSRQKKAMPRIYSIVSRHSASFLRTLSDSWSCLNSNGVHSTHTAKLFLDTEASDDYVNFRMLLEYEAISENMRQRGLLFLRIRSEELSHVDIGLPLPNMPPDRSSAETLLPPAKARRVRFADSPSQSSSRTCRATNTECQPRKNLTHNLCQAKDVCHHVFEHGKALHQSRKEGCIGYLVSGDNLTHQLMAAQDKESTAIQTRPCSPATLASIIQPSKQADISVNEQLRLALRLARSVLHELSVSLATLHIDAKLVPKQDNMAMQNIICQVPTTSSDHDAQLLCGIRNVTLHSLGVALLQIGRWELLHTQDLVVIRKAAAKPSRLGPRYDDLTARCLWCDFGFGADLNKPQLQEAIYERVIHELEQMVDLLERADA